MFWFIRYRFSYLPQNADPSKALAEVLQQEKWRKIIHRITRERVRLQHKLPRLLPNYWNPIFEGRVVHSGGRTYLVGYFRAPWLIFISNFLTMAIAAYQLLSTWYESPVREGHVEIGPQLITEAGILAVLALLMLFGWLLGLPSQWRILEAIQESTGARE